MRLSADIAPPNSLLLIMDPATGVVPESMAGGLAASTPSCVAVGTLAQQDGTTRVTLADSFGPAVEGPPIFDGVLETPARKLAVCTVLGAVVLETAVGAERTRVRIWVDDPAEPGELLVRASAVRSQLEAVGPAD